MKKKIIFVLCTVIILCLGSIVSAATNLTDVKNTKYEDSVNTLITFGVVNGYPEDNTYRPNNIVTRAQMAKLMVLSLGEEERVAAAAKGTAKFSDVKSGTWEYGYINAAAELGIINGYPDGSFGPQNTVSYAEATTMIIRALDYEDEVKKSTEYWPNNYITQAKKLSLYTSVGTINSNDGAKRGNVAILLWNMLRTGVCAPVGQVGTEVIYGEGEPLLNKTIDGFMYYKDAVITEVEFDKSYEYADVKMTAGNKNVKFTMDALEAAEMYGQEFDVLYNTTNKEIESAVKNTEKTIKEGEVTKIKSNKIYLNGSSTGYKLPDDKNILLYGVDSIYDAVTATLVFSGSTLKYVVGYAPEKVYLALVTNTEATVSNKDGIKVINYKESSTKSYALEDKSQMPEIDDIILYYLNSDDELIIIDKSNVFESKEVTNATTTKIETSKNSYKLSDTLYQIAKVTSTSLKSMSSTSIEEDVDSVDVISFAGERYYIIYDGGLDEALTQLKADIKTACDKLNKDYINNTTVKNVYNNKELDYTLATYTKFVNLYDDAKTAIAAAESTANKTNLNKVNTIYTDIKAAYSGLKLVSSLSTTEKADETNLINAKRALRNIVNGTTKIGDKKVSEYVAKSGDYTTASYTTFSTALKNANDALKSTSVTQNRLENLTDDLKDAIERLITKSEDTERTTALQALTVAINSGDAKKQNASSYTEDSYNNLVSALRRANSVKSDSRATIEDIKNATTDLITAIALLSNSLEEILDDLNELLLNAQEKLTKTEIYMPETYSELKKYYDAAQLVKGNSNSTKAQIEECYTKLKDAYDNLYKIDDKVKDVKDKAKTYNLQAIKDAGEALTYELSSGDKIAKMEALEDAMNQEDIDMKRFKDYLQTEISVAELIASSIETQEDWVAQNYKGTLEEMKNALKEAKDLLGDSGKETISSVTLKAAWEALQDKLAKNS